MGGMSASELRPSRGRPRVPSVSSLGHVGIAAKDMDRMLDFYTGTLGLTVTDGTGANACWPRRGYKGVQDATGDGHVVVADDRPVYTLKSSPAVPASYEEAIERARALKPRLRERVPETERLRRLPAENVADL